MQLSENTIVKLRELINEETEYRSGPKLVEFFKRLGFSYTYGPGFPSRWIFTEDCLNQINGSQKLENCIKLLFAPTNYIGRFEELKKFIEDFNQYLFFDGWRVVVKGKSVNIIRINDNDIILGVESDEDLFLRQEFIDIPITQLGLEQSLQSVVAQRIDEIKKAHKAGAYLAVIFLAGSTLEGLLLGVVSRNLPVFYSCPKAPKDKSGKPKGITEWKLKELIDVACSVGFIKEDVRKFSQVLRDFRNYIHPMQQMSSQFYPDEHTSKICLQVLRAAIFQLQQKSEKKS